MAMSVPSLPKTWVAGQVVTAAHLNGNFTTIRDYLNTSGGALNAANTWTVAQTFSGGATVSAGGITVTGNSTITGTLGGITTLSVTTVTATSLGGTLTTPAQANVTSVGTLTALAISGTVTMSAAASKIVPGVTSFSHRNNADSADNFLISDAGDCTVRSGRTLTAGAVNSVTMSATGQINGLHVSVDAGATIATTSTDHMLLITKCAGAPTGVVADGHVILDTTNHRIYFRSGSAWKYAALT